MCWFRLRKLGLAEIAQFEFSEEVAFEQRLRTLQDRPRLLPRRPAAIADLIKQPRPVSLSSRTPYEHRVFTVTASVTKMIAEADQDFHLVLRDAAGNTMIAESTSPMCAAHATPLRRRQIAAVHGAVERCMKARVTGVAFFDFKHHQTGVAPNAIELHPILNFVCLTN